MSMAAFAVGLPIVRCMRCHMTSRWVASRPMIAGANRSSMTAAMDFWVSP